MSEDTAIYKIEQSPDLAANVELCVVVEGKVTQSNLPTFRNFVTAHMAAINETLSTDAEFDQAETDVKNLGTTEDMVKKVKKCFLEQTEDINAVLIGLDEIVAALAKKRLHLKSQIDSQRKASNARMVVKYLNQVDCAPSLRMPKYHSVVEAAIKGKRTADSKEKALVQIVGMLNEGIHASRAAIEEYEARTGVKAFDRDALECQPAESVRLLLQGREQAQLAADEKKRLQKAADDERVARLTAEAEAKQSAHGQTSLVESVAAPVVRTVPTPAPAPTAVPTVPPQGETAEEELAIYITVAMQCFAPLKAARNTLQHAGNIERVDQFRAALNQAWGALKGGEA